MMRCRSVIRGMFGLLLVVASISTATAAIRLPAVIGDNMVLQRGQSVPIWGWARPGQEVTVVLDCQTLSTKADDRGRWKVLLAELKPGGPIEMKIKTDTDTLTLKNVLVGDVWLASGQSNMEMNVQSSKDAQKEIEAANYPKIRLFTVSRQKNTEPSTVCEGEWAECNPSTIRGFSAVAYQFGRKLHKDLDVPVGLISTSWGGTRCEPWTSRRALEGKQIPQGVETEQLYNAMIAPLIPYAIRGAIWYQGESNIGQAYQYRDLFPTMIRNWREDWKQGDFPFYFVQIAPFRYNNPPAEPELWEAQLMTVKSVPNTGMAVTTDIGELGDIHPKNKQEVGRRLALWALAKDYGKDVAFSGPLYKEMKVDGDKIRIKFDYAEGLKSSDGKPLGFFTIAGEDQKFVPADAQVDGDTIVVSSKDIAKPVAVRFGWREDAEPNFVNAAGLPASPFRTDSWKGVTQP